MTTVTWTNTILLAVVATQWLLMTIVLSRHPETMVQELHSWSSGVDLTESTETPTTPTAKNAPVLIKDGPPPSTAAALRQLLEQRQIEFYGNQTGEVITTEQPPLLKGVALTLIFRAPKWFHLRYKVMLDNALANIPEDWKVQVILNVDWAVGNLWPWHPGLVRLLTNDPRVLVTPLPSNMTKMKPKVIMASSWLWNSIPAEHVMVFSGNGAFCGNHPTVIWEQLQQYDFVGIPHHAYPGGDASSHSWRSRRAMMEILADSTVDATSSAAMAKKLLQLQSADEGRPFQIADSAMTQRFGGVYNLSHSEGVERVPLVVAGTQARLTYAERDSLLKHCPELKVIFPSLHEPACFGAHPKPDTCRASICALQEQVPSHGC